MRPDLEIRIPDRQRIREHRSGGLRQQAHLALQFLCRARDRSQGFPRLPGRPLWWSEVAAEHQVRPGPEPLREALPSRGILEAWSLVNEVRNLPTFRPGNAFKAARPWGSRHSKHLPIRSERGRVWRKRPEPIEYMAVSRCGINTLPATLARGLRCRLSAPSPAIQSVPSSRRICHLVAVSPSRRCGADLPAAGTCSARPVAIRL